MTTSDAGFDWKAVSDAGPPPAKAPEWQVKQWLKEVIKRNFEPRAYSLREELSELQLGLLDRLSQYEDVSFYQAGVPRAGKVRRRWLELDAPGPLNRRVEVTIQKRRCFKAQNMGDVAIEPGTYSWPIWKVLLVAFDDPKQCRKLVTDRFSPVEILDLHSDRAYLKGDGVFRDFEDALPPMMTCLKEAGAGALEWARTTTERMLKEPKQPKWLTNWLGNVVLLPIVRSLKEGETLDPRYDTLVVLRTYEGLDPTILPEVLARVPLERREPIFIDYGSDWSTSSLGFCPTRKFATLLLESMDGKHTTEEGEAAISSSDIPATLATLVKMGQQHPAVADGLKSYKAEDKDFRQQLKAALAQLAKTAGASKLKPAPTAKKTPTKPTRKK